MPSLLNIGAGGSAGNINDLIQAASTPPAQTSSPSGGFRKILGGVVGAAANVFAPGLGSVIGNVIGGSSSQTSSGLGSTPAQFLQIQAQMEMEHEAFTMASNVMKDRHDAAMTAIQNSKSN